MRSAWPTSSGVSRGDDRQSGQNLELLVRTVPEVEHRRCSADTTGLAGSEMPVITHGAARAGSGSDHAGAIAATEMRPQNIPEAVRSLCKWLARRGREGACK